MCLPVAFGRFLVFCFLNGSYVEFRGQRVWSELSAACPPVKEVSPESDGSVVARPFRVPGLLPLATGGCCLDEYQEVNELCC